MVTAEDRTTEGDEGGRAPGLSSLDWADEASQRWLAHAEQLEAMLGPVDDLLLPATRLEPGATVLDVGCGRGVTARAAAAAVGPTGHVTGVDISAALIAEAAAMLPLPDSAHLSWVTGDAATHPFPPSHHHRVISRFGVMFFDHPVAGFANLRRTTRPDGQLVAAVWQPRDASDFQSLAIDVAVRVAARHGLRLQPDPPDAGPFAYGSAPYTTGLLERAGWTDVEVVPQELDLYLGGPGTTPEQAVELGRNFGPLGILLNDTPSDIADAIARAVTDELAMRWDGTGVPLRAAIAIVTARPAHGDRAG
jgi:SAM-dependent methyltransferase